MHFLLEDIQDDVGIGGGADGAMSNRIVQFCD
jgi:hypothetical protein